MPQPSTPDTVRTAFEQLVQDVFSNARGQFEAQGFFVAAAPTGFRMEHLGTDTRVTTNSLLVRDPTTDLWLEFTLRLRTLHPDGAATHEVLAWVQVMGEAEALTKAWGPCGPDSPMTTAELLAAPAALREGFVAALPDVLEHCNQRCAL